MLPRADLSNALPAQPVTSTSNVKDSVNPRQETLHRLNQIALGTRLHASVQSRLGDGTYVVQVGTTFARMNLPQGTQVGDRFLMTMLAHTPRPTFLLNGDAGSVQTNLSSAARFVDQILQTSQQRGDASPVVTAKSPLLASPATLGLPGAPQLLAQSMQYAVAYSGLFYESHLQQWATGKRTASELAQEPHIRQQSDSPQSNELARVPLLNGSSDIRGAQLDILRAAKLLSGNNASTDADTVLEPLTNEAMPEDAAQKISHQLHVLEHRQVAWQGEFVPGTQLDWTVKEEAGHQSEDPEQRLWKSTVRFELPSLGTIAATIVLHHGRVQIDIHTPSEETGNVLHSFSSRLADALAAAGSPLDGLLIKQNEKA